MAENQTILLYKTLRGHLKNMSQPYRMVSSTKKVIKCDIGGKGSKQSVVPDLSKNDTVKFQVILTLKHLYNTSIESRNLNCINLGRYRE